MSQHPELGRLDGMDIYADDSIDVSPICSINNGRCSTFCFPTPSGRTCGCQDNVQLQSDQLTCEGVKFCPSSLENAVLSPDCLRRSGDSCSYFCAQGYVSSTIEKLLCTTEGVWNTDTTKLCSMILCPSSLENAVLSPDCLRRPRDSCSFSCAQGYEPSTKDKLLCTTEGVWNKNTTILCSIILCPSSLENAVFSPDCLRRPGDSCSFSCAQGYEPSTKDKLLCTTEGVWNKNTTILCSKIIPKQNKEGNAESKISLYVGGAVGGLIVIIIVVVAIIFLLKRRNSGRETGVEYEQPVANFNLSNGDGPKPEDHYCTLSF
ncbi:E-selectin-like isoform X1 [Crassostrea virginica]